MDVLQITLCSGLTCQRVSSSLGVAIVLTLWQGIGGLRPSFGGDFDSQVQHLLEKEMLTQQEKANLSVVFNDLQATLQTKWQGSEVIPLGSFVTGLASKTSDADCMVTVPGHDMSSIRYLITETAVLLKQRPGLYHQVKAKIDPTRRIPLLKFTYVPTGRNCDVNFISNIALKNSHMMGYYFSLDKKFRYLAAILKFWSKIHNLRSTKSLASNSLNLLIIFYLQQLNIAPPFNLLQKHIIRCPVNIWETSFKRIRYNSTITSSLYELLGGFFKYYSQFNFDEFVVTPFFGRPILKREFKDVNNLPEEFSLYKNYMQRIDSKPLVLDTKICVQDAIELRRNTADVPLNKANHFITHIKFAAKLYDTFPKDLFLRILLAKYHKSNIVMFKPLIQLDDTGFCCH